jgi:hypothetical protein
LKDYHRRFPGIDVELPEDQIYVSDEQGKQDLTAFSSL